MARASRPASRVAGQTRDTGFQIGVRRTLPIAAEAAWRLISSEAGVRAWLGAAPPIVFEPGAAYTLADGASGEIRVVQPQSHMRLTWQPGGWPRSSTIQVRVLPKGLHSTIAFHQEHLPDAAAREQRRAHYEAALDALARLYSSTSSE